MTAIIAPFAYSAMHIPVRILLHCLVCVLLLGAANSYGGFLNSVLKAAKKIESPEGTVKSLSDINLSQVDLSFPNKEPPEILSLKKDLNNEWVIRNSSGQLVTDTSSFKNPVLVIEKPYLPLDMSQLKSVMPEVPLLVRSGRNIYEVRRKTGVSIRLGSVVMEVHDMDAFHKALYHLDAPWLTHKVNIMGAGTSSNQSLRSLEPSFFMASTSKLRGETLVVGGELKGDKLLLGKESLSLSVLQSRAQQYDISLVILDAKKTLSPEQIEKRITGKGGDGPQSTGAFLNQMKVQGSETTYQWNPHSGNYVLIQKKMRAERDQSYQNVNTAVEVSSGFAIQGLLLFRPDQARQKELQSRWLWWLPSDVSLYLLVSSFAGFTSFGTSRGLMRKLRRSKARSEFNWALSYYLVRFIRLLSLVVIVIPLFGLPCLLFAIFYVIYQVFRWFILGLLKLVRSLTNGAKALY